MPKFRAKTEAFEAFQWKGGITTPPEWIEKAIGNGVITLTEEQAKSVAWLKTENGPLKIKEGSYLVLKKDHTIHMAEQGFFERTQEQVSD